MYDVNVKGTKGGNPSIIIKTYNCTKLVERPKNSPDGGSSSFVCSRLNGHNEWACLHRTPPDRLQDEVFLVVPRAKGLEQLDDLVLPALAHVVDADRAHLDVVVKQKVEQGKETLELVFVVVVSAPTWKRVVGDR